MLARVDDAGAHKVLRVGVDAVQQLHAKANQLGANGRDVQWLRCLEDLLRSLLVSVGKIFHIVDGRTYFF